MGSHGMRLDVGCWCLYTTLFLSVVLSFIIITEYILYPHMVSTSIASQYPLRQNSQKIMIDTQMVMAYWKQGLVVSFGRMPFGKCNCAEPPHYQNQKP